MVCRFFSKPMRMLRSICYINFALRLALVEGGAVMPTFVFPDEEDDPYFVQNVASIKRSIRKALQDGCLDAWPLETQTEISILFRHDARVPETSDFYIQYQMEQVAASQAEAKVGGFRKLLGAIQVWDWSPRHVELLRSSLPGAMTRKILYVPLPGSLDEVDCTALLEGESCRAVAPADAFFFLAR
eukprot:TRINITY_DN7130_c0_g2_i1.p1 TRINITY_DN7130_c0_g2~~TRINITY_DN7130_c0_g2_i1.p1  ORF type:complete len:186 (+),score=26.01 TRINITY_DN7130_c0_g2_i1:162-719(+)